MRCKNKNIIVSAYAFLFIILIVFMSLQMKIIALSALILIIVETFVIVFSFSREKRNVMNTFNVYASNKNYQDAILYLKQLLNKNIYPGTKIFANSLIVLSYIELGRYDEGYSIIKEVKWYNLTYIYYGYYAILLNLYFENILGANNIFKKLKQIRNKHLNNQILISAELLKMVDGSNYDRDIINDSKIELVNLIVKKYEK